MKSILNQRGYKYVFGVNYCQLVLDTMADRLDVQTVQTGEDGNLQEWVDELFELNRFRELQSDLHLATVRDGDAFIIPEFNEEEDRVELTVNYAYSDKMGVIPFYDAGKLVRAIKVVELERDGDFSYRIYEYTPDRVSESRFEGGEKQFGGENSGGWQNVRSHRWDAGIIPVVHFSNRRLQGEDTGLSELASVVALQDALNAAVITAMGASYLSGFPTAVWKSGSTQAVLPSSRVPGQILGFINSNENLLSASDFKYNDSPDFSGNLNLITDLVQHIASISNTPLAISSLANVSGETIKQIDVKLLAKVRNAQIKLGNSWEDVVRLAIAMQNSYGTKVVGKVENEKLFRTQWKEAEIRNHFQVVEIARMIFEATGDLNLFMHQTADIHGLGEAEIERVVKEGEKRMQEGMLQQEGRNGVGYNGRPRVRSSDRHAAERDSGVEARKRAEA